MLTVHHLNRSRSKRVLWLLEELGMPYERVDHQRDPQTQLAPESLRAVHPLAKAPVMTDQGMTLCESSTIMEYILDKDGTDSLRPKAGTPEYYAYLEWSHFAEGSLALPVIAKLMMGMEERAGNQTMDAYIAKEIKLDFDYIDSTLAERTWFAGEQFTAADIMMTIMLEMSSSLGLTQEYPHIQAYLERVQQRAAYQKAVSFG